MRSRYFFKALLDVAGGDGGLHIAFVVVDQQRGGLFVREVVLEARGNSMAARISLLMTASSNSGCGTILILPEPRNSARMPGESSRRDHDRGDFPPWPCR